MCCKQFYFRLYRNYSRLTKYGKKIFHTKITVKIFFKSSCGTGNAKYSFFYLPPPVQFLRLFLKSIYPIVILIYNFIKLIQA